MKTKYRIVILLMLGVLSMITAIVFRVGDIPEEYIGDWLGYYKTDVRETHFGDFNWKKESEVYLAQFGGREWHCCYLSDDDKYKETLHQGRLMYVYRSIDDDKKSEYYGDDITLWIYDISGIISENGELANDSINRKTYLELAAKYVDRSDSSYYFTEKYSPHVAVETNTSLIISNKKFFRKETLIFTNERVYHFIFINDKIKYSGRQTFEYLDSHFNDIVSQIDFKSYWDWNVKRVNYLRAEKDFYSNLTGVQCLLILVSIMVASIPLGSKNKSARKLYWYLSFWTLAYVCFLLFLINDMLSPFDVCYRPCYYKLEALLWYSIPITIIISILLAACREYSLQEYEKYYIVPTFVQKTICRNSDVKKRILFVVYFAPLFYVFPIPFAGWFFFLFYILPMTIFVAIWYAIEWIRGDKSVVTADGAKKQKIYCRYCGEKIDPAACFCRHCGKRI